MRTAACLVVNLLFSSRFRHCKPTPCRGCVARCFGLFVTVRLLKGRRYAMRGKNRAVAPIVAGGGKNRAVAPIVAGGGLLNPIPRSPLGVTVSAVTGDFA